MLSKYTKLIVSVLMTLLMVACASSPKQPAIVIDKKDSTLIPVLSSDEKNRYAEAIEYFKSKDYPSAAKIFNELTQKYPRLAGAYVNLGLIDEAQGDTDSALGRYKVALNINPNNISALIQRAKINQVQGQFLEAETDLIRAHTIDEKNTIVNYNLGLLYEKYLQNFDLAIEHYEAYVESSKADDVRIVKRWIQLLERK